MTLGSAGELAESLIRRSIRSGEVVSAPYSVELDRELWERGTTDDSTPEGELRYLGDRDGDEWAVELIRLTPNARRTQLPPSAVVRVSGLMAGAYKGARQNLAALLTHAWVEGHENGKSLCGKISIASMSDLTSDRPPTCEVCARRLGSHPITDDFPDLLSRRERSHTPNASHYVWVLPPGGLAPLSEGPYGPMDLKSACQMARIAAMEGTHDRVVSLGLDPEARSFQIERRYAARSGERIA